MNSFQIADSGRIPASAPYSDSSPTSGNMTASRQSSAQDAKNKSPFDILGGG
ncbi:MAG TPA: hypothetical protein VGE97_07770 [Nitrososphaera sp.]